MFPPALSMLLRKLNHLAFKNTVSTFDAFTPWRFTHDSLALLVKSEIILQRDFVSDDEEKNLVDELDAYLNRHHYQKAHWDYAITNYRETERKTWRSINRAVIERLKEFTAKTEIPIDATSDLPVEQKVLSHIHVLDLAEDGEIKPHVDSVRFCGGSVVVISLLSDAVLRLAVAPPDEVVGLPCNQPHLQTTTLPPVGSFVDIRIPQRSVYVMRGVTRYLLTHGILANSQVSQLHSEYTSDLYDVHRVRRLSLICRSRPMTNMIQLQAKDSGIPTPACSDISEQ